MGTEGASCFHTFSSASRDIPRSEWDDVRFGMLCGNSMDFSEMKQSLLELCKVSKRCIFNPDHSITIITDEE